jgi:hypothetical protein
MTMPPLYFPYTFQDRGSVTFSLFLENYVSWLFPDALEWLSYTHK